MNCEINKLLINFCIDRIIVNIVYRENSQKYFTFPKQVEKLCEQDWFKWNFYCAKENFIKQIIRWTKFNYTHNSIWFDFGLNSR